MTKGLPASPIGTDGLTGQSAGNAPKFSPVSDHRPRHRKPTSSLDFAYYLAGLIEGDGCFSDKRLEIVFHEDDKANAYFIKKVIGFGTVSKIKDKKTVKFVLRHMAGLCKVVHLVNGKFRTQDKINQWRKHNYDKVFDVEIATRLDQSSLLSHFWLAGFTDADGCFHISIVHSQTHKLGKSVRLEFKVTQKDSIILKQIQEAFGGSISFYAKENLFKYNSVSLSSAFRVISYFDRYQCNSIPKLVAYIKWRNVYRIIQRKEHLTLSGLEKICRLKMI